MSEGWVYDDVTVKRVVDGDTVDLTLRRDIGFYHISQVTLRFRLVECNCPERGMPGYDEATQFTQDWLSSHELVATTFKHDANSSVPDGGFGRWLVNLTDGVGGPSLSDALMESGHAVKYERK